MEPLYNYLGIGLVLLALICARSKRKGAHSVFLVVSFVVLSFLTACRYESGASDYRNYLLAFYQFQFLDLRELFKYDEAGFALFDRFLGLFFNNAQSFHMVAGCFINFSFMRFLNRHSPYPKVSILLFVLLGTYFSAHNGTRQYIAAAICLFAYEYLLQRRFVPFLLLVVIASAFHTSALLAILLYPICKGNYGSGITGAYFVSIPILLIGFPMFLRFGQIFIYSGYSNDSYGMIGSNKLNYILPVIYLLLLFIGSTLCEKKTRRIDFVQHSNAENMIFHMTSIYSAIIIVSTYRAINFGRLAWYVSVGPALFIPLFINTYIEKKQQRFAISIVTVFAVVYLIVNNMAGNLTPTPYDFFWNHSSIIVGDS